MQWQLKALVAAVSLSVSAMASAQAASSTIVDVKPSDVGAAGTVVTPSGSASSASDCSALNSDGTIRCVQRQPSSVVTPDNVVRSPPSGMTRRGGTMPGERSGAAGLGAAAGAGGANGKMGSAGGAAGGAKGGGGSG